MIVSGSVGYSCNKVAVAGTDFKYQFCLKGCDLILFNLTSRCYDSNSGMSFEEPNNPRSSEIVKNQVQLTELATYEERTPEVEEGKLLKMCVLLPLNTLQKPVLAS